MKLNQHFVLLNLSVFLISTSGLFGRLLSLSPELTIFYRCLVAALFLFLFIRYKGISLKTADKSHNKYILIGGIMMAIHWVSYFYALSLSSIAIAMLTLHIFPALTTILEPLILKTKFEFYHLILAICVIAGIWIILPSLDLSDKIVLATFCGIISALSYALRNIWTRKIMIHYNASLVMFYHLCIMTLLLSPFLAVKSSATLHYEWSYILALALVTTVIGHTLLVNSLKHFSAVSVSLISSIIPVYGILWGIFLLSEFPDKKTLIGGAFIMATFLIESYVSNKRIQNEKSKT